MSVQCSVTASKDYIVSIESEKKHEEEESFLSFGDEKKAVNKKSKSRFLREEK